RPERKRTMTIEGITWHAVTLDGEQQHAGMKDFLGKLGLAPAMDVPGFVLYQMPNGTTLELYTPQGVPPYGYNGPVAVRFRADDIEAASAAVAAAGGELLGEITRMADIGYAYRHFRGPD